MILALSIPVFAVLQAARATELELITLFEDDAYYYFTIARNLAAGLGSTFDTIHPTNGYHPLWLALLTPLFILVQGEFYVLVAVKALSALFWISSFILLYFIARRYRAEIALAIALPVLLLARHFWFNGLETSVFLTMLLAFGLAWPGLVDRDEPSRADWWAGSLSLALMVLARLDSVFLLAAAGVFVFSTPPGKPLTARIRRSVRLLSPAALTLSVYCLANRFLFGSFVPVSGSAKALGAHFSNWNILARFWRMNPFESNLTQGLSTGPLLLALVVPALVAGYLIDSKAVEKGGAARSWTLFVALLVVANTLQLLYYACFTTWPLWRWYYYYLPVLFLFSLALILRAFFVMLPFLRRWGATAAVAIALLLSAYVGRGELWIQHALAVNESYKTFSVLMANRLNASSPADSILAMGDRAGSLGYQVDRPLIQLEGLVNSGDYLHSLESGEATEYLRARGVTHLVYSGPWVAAQEDLTSQPCRIIDQPLHGGGPKEQFELCLEEALFVRPLLIRTGHREVYGIWDFEQVAIPTAEPPQGK
jgi:hypothetical protein